MCSTAGRASVDAVETFEHVLLRWCAAEAAGDAAALDVLLDADFQGDGPHSGVLGKERWIALGARAFVWTPTAVRVRNRTAVARGIGRDSSGAFQSTLVAVRRGDHWTIVNVQIAHLADVPRAALREGAGMADNDTTQSIPAPEPHPALRRLDRLIGTWSLKGHLVGSDEDNIVGQVSYQWLEGGHFLQQDVEIDFAGQVQIKAREIIGYDPETGALASRVYSNLSPEPLPYKWDLQGDTLTISISHGPMDATFTGTVGADGNSFAGGWRPNPGADESINVPYDVSGSRI